MFEDLKKFLMRGNVVELAVGIAVGAAFTQIVNSLVGDILTPVISLVFGKPDFSKYVLGPVKIGVFLNSVVNFLIVGTSLFFVIKGITKLAPPPAEKPKGPSQEELLAEIRDLLREKGEPASG